MTYSVELKIKRKNLADESRDIRKEEFKAKKAGDTSTLNSLHDHRINIVRPAARSAHLAHAFLRRKPYASVEASCRKGNEPNIRSIASTVRKFGTDEQRATDPDEMKEIIVSWLAGEYAFPELQLEAA